MADDGLISMADQFKGLPMADLIGGPLKAACDAQVNLALATATFIQQIGFQAPDAATGAQAVRTVAFKFNRQSATAEPNTTGGATVYPMETVELDVPLLAIVKVPALSVTTVDITFDMEVKNTVRSSETEDKSGKFSADASVGYGPFKLNVHVEGSVATHKENTRETDQSAKYHVEVHAEDKGMPEGLSRVLDMMMQAIAPKSVTPAAPAAAGDLMNPPAQDVLPAPAAVDRLDHAPTAAAQIAASAKDDGDVEIVVRGTRVKTARA